MNTSPSTPHAKPVAAPSAKALGERPAQGLLPAAQSLRSTGHLIDYAAVPAFIRVLSHGDNPPIALFKAKQHHLVALEQAEKKFVVLCLKNENGGTAWFHLIEQGKRLGLKFAGSFTCESDVLHMVLQENVFEKEAVQAYKEREEERQSVTRMMTDSAPIEWLRTTIRRCMTLGASDVHFEVRGDHTMLRVRRDGIMRKVGHYPTRIVVNGLSAAYTVLAEEGSRSEVAFNAGAVQSAMVPLEWPEQKILMRYQSHPTVVGFDAAMRILRVGGPSEVKIPELEYLGYTAWQIERIKEAIGSSWGGVFVAGITGSGKTTTLSSLLNRLAAQSQRKIIAIEDPVEYQVPGVTHLSVRRQMRDSTANPFQEAMLAFLRMDPDVGMFGEIRDHLSGQMAHAAIQTGHKLLTTVHATSALGIVARLTSQHIGLLREDVCSPEFLSLLMYQVLIPKNCNHCKVPADQVMSPAELAAYEQHFQMDPKSFRCASDTGCPHCQVEGLDRGDQTHVGVSGVKVCAEVMPITNDLLRLLRDKDDIRARDEWLAQRTTPFDSDDMLGKEAWGHALYEVSQGVLDPFHFERNFGPPGLLALSRNLK
jgi:type II secretory ATPase GspE/PulE/Tfp pilus assembly ATPase PilB-like protein